MKRGVIGVMRDVRDYWLVALAILSVVLLLMVTMYNNVASLIVLKGIATTLQQTCGVGG